MAPCRGHEPTCLQLIGQHAVPGVSVASQLGEAGQRVDGDRIAATTPLTGVTLAGCGAASAGAKGCGVCEVVAAPAFTVVLLTKDTEALVLCQQSTEGGCHAVV